MTNLEDLLAAEIEKHGVRATPDTFRQMLTDTIGRMNSQGLIALPAGTITLPDYVRSVRQANPELFLDASEPEATTGNVTRDMIRELRQTRSKGLPSDWTTVRNRCAGLTAQYMDEIAGERQN